jgi:hypothetical protein
MPRPCGARVPRPGFLSDIPQTCHRKPLEGQPGRAGALEVSRPPRHGGACPGANILEGLEGRRRRPGSVSKMWQRTKLEQPAVPDVARVTLDKSDGDTLCQGFAPGIPPEEREPESNAR